MGFGNVSQHRAIEDPSRPLPADSKLSCPIKAVMTSKYQFSPSIPTGGVVCLIGSASVMAEEMVRVVAFVKPVSDLLGLLPNGGITQLDKLVWGHWFIALGSTLSRSWRRFQLVNTTCSFTVSLNSMSLPTKGWKSGPSGRLNFSAQYCSPLA